jgi:hypothetical protein
MGTIATVPLSTIPIENYPVLNVANGIVPDEALAISVGLQFSASVQALLIDVTEAGRKFSDIPVQGAFVDCTNSALDVVIQIPASGQAIIAKSGTQGYYAMLVPMPVRLIAQIKGSPAAATTVQLILYNTVIEPNVWGQAAGPIGPSGPPGVTGPQGPQGIPGPQSPWTGNIDGGGNNLSNVGSITASTITGTTSLCATSGVDRLCEQPTQMAWATSGNLRWAWQKTGTESGSNTGSNLQLLNYGDTGAFLGTPVQVTRATGYLGILTSGAPDEALTVGGAVHVLGTMVTANVANSLILDISGGNSRLRSWGGNVTTLGGFSFDQLHSDGTGAVQAMVISPSSKVGIGPVSPLTPLHVRQGVSSTIPPNTYTSIWAETATGTPSYIEATTGGGGSGTCGVLFSNGFNSTSSISDASNQLTLTAGSNYSMVMNVNNSTQAMNILPSGLIGIGTAGLGNPSFHVHVYGGPSTPTGSYCTPSNNVGNSVCITDSGGLADNGGALFLGVAQGNFAGIRGSLSNGLGTYMQGDMVFFIRANAADSRLNEAMRIIASGNVGIKLATPAHLLELGVDDAAKPSTNTWTISSDIRTKRNISSFDSDINIVRKLAPIVAQYNGRGGTPEGARVVSFDAEKLRELIPQAVSSTRGKLDADGEETDILGINTHEIFFHLLRAVQNIDRRLMDLEASRGRKR